MNRALASSAKPNLHDRIFDTQEDDYHPWVFSSANLSETISGPLRETKTTMH